MKPKITKLLLLTLLLVYSKFSFSQQGCQDNTIIITTTFWVSAPDISWTLTDASGTILASLPVNSTPFTTVQSAVCVPDGCYNMNLATTNGDYGWNNTFYRIKDLSGNVLAQNTLWEGNSQIDVFAVGQTGVCIIDGCTDATAQNYNPFATNNDGTCVFTCTSTPYTESFDNGFGIWHQAPNQPFGTDIGNWINMGLATYTPLTGPPSGLNETGKYIYTDASFSDGDYTLTSECFDLSTLSTPTFYFWHYLYGSSLDTLEIKANGNIVWSYYGTQDSLQFGIINNTSYVPSWKLEQVDLSTYAGTNVNITIKANTGTDAIGDIAIDQITINNAGLAGCTDNMATNYNLLAVIDDGTCVLPCTDNMLYISMNDAWGDGWNGNALTISDTTGNVLHQTSLLVGSSGTDSVCLPSACNAYDSILLRRRLSLGGKLVNTRRGRYNCLRSCR